MMINDVKNMVNFVLNKESRGYITPLQFNTFAKQAQQEIIDDYLSDYNKSVVGKNSRNNYKEVVSKAKEGMDAFAVPPTTLTYNSASGLFESPNDLYAFISLVYNNSEVEEVGRDKLSYFLTNPTVGPSVYYPAFVRYNNDYKVFPDTISTNVKLMYFRTPKDPNWTYEMINGNPIFNPSKSGFQDFEVGFEDKFSLIIKILKYAGLNVREADIVGAAVAMENANNLN
jgi:hypothetical protein